MSYWSHIFGTIIVHPMGYSQPQKRYILDTILEHLPLVCGSEGVLKTHVNQRDGFDCTSNIDDFGQRSNLLNAHWDNPQGPKYRQSEYIISVEADLRDVEDNEALRMFMKWLCRLSKRVHIYDVLASVNGIILQNNGDVYTAMFEWPSWVNDTDEPTWCEYMMHETIPGGFYPAVLARKYPNRINMKL